MDFDKTIIIKMPEELKRVSFSIKYSLELAWKRDDFIDVIGYLKSHNYGILGGDVYLIIGSETKITYLNWYIDNDENIEWDEYVQKSADKAIDYVNKHYEREGDDFCYVPVFAGWDDNLKELVAVDWG